MHLRPQLGDAALDQRAELHLGGCEACRRNPQLEQAGAGREPAYEITDSDPGWGTDCCPVVTTANDENWFYLRFDTTVEIQPDEQQDIRLYLDTDLDAATGTAFGGIGDQLRRSSSKGFLPPWKG